MEGQVLYFMSKMLIKYTLTITQNYVYKDFFIFLSYLTRKTDRIATWTVIYNNGMQIENNASKIKVCP